MLAVLKSFVSALSMVPQPIVPDPAEASNSMNRALPLVVIATANCTALPGKFQVMTPRLSAPIVYVPVNACAVSAAPVPTPFVSSLPLVRLPAPSAVNMPTAAEIETVPFPLILSAPAPAGGAHEIGRASCRDRGG